MEGVSQVLRDMEEIRLRYINSIGLKHRNICTMHPLEWDNRYGYILVMEYIPGETLWDYARAKPNAKLEHAEVVQFLAPIADALNYIHSRGLVHLDIRPENIMIMENGEPQLIDFGLAAPIHGMSNKPQRVGVSLYRAPEQWQGANGDARTDQYAFGVLAYELLAGVLPFDYANSCEMIDHVCHKPMPLIPGVSDSVNAVLAKVMAKEGKNRYDNCRGFIDALTSAITHAEQ